MVVIGYLLDVFSSGEMSDDKMGQVTNDGLRIDLLETWGNMAL